MTENSGVLEAGKSHYMLRIRFLCLYWLIMVVEEEHKLVGLSLRRDLVIEEEVVVVDGEKRAQIYYIL